MNMNPCKGCLERHVACWDKCEKYLSVKREKDALRKKRVSYAEEHHFYMQKLHDVKQKGKR